MTFINTLIGTVAFAILAPIVGCLLAGLDRIISARMQGRVGPPLLQPYYDVRKLIDKDDVTVSGVDGVYMTCALVFTAFAGGIFFSGGNLLMSAFIITMAALFFIMAAYSSRSPYAEVGAGRETLQVMSYEPMVLLMAVCFFMTTSTFMVRDIFFRQDWKRCAAVLGVKRHDIRIHVKTGTRLTHVIRNNKIQILLVQFLSGILFDVIGFCRKPDQNLTCSFHPAQFRCNIGIFCQINF